jgi:hypothetical protein
LINSPATPPARRAALLVAFMWFAYFLTYSDRQAVFSMFPVFKSDLEFPAKRPGLEGAANGSRGGCAPRASRSRTSDCFHGVAS